jgi:hypothetical protein
MNILEWQIVIYQQQWLHSTQFAMYASAKSASAKSAPALGYFIRKYGLVLGLDMLRKVGWLPRTAYKNAKKWRNRSRTPQIKIYLIIINGRIVVIRGTYSVGSHGPSIYDVESTYTWHLQGHTAYGVNTITWSMELLHGPSHPIIEDMPEPPPLLSPAVLKIRQQDINKEIGRLNQLIRQLTHEADRNKLAEIALMCIP